MWLGSAKVCTFRKRMQTAPLYISMRHHYCIDLVYHRADAKQTCERFGQNNGIRRPGKRHSFGNSRRIASRCKKRLETKVLMFAS